MTSAGTVYPKKYAHGFVVLCFVVVMQSFIMNSHKVFIHIHQGCFAGTGAIVRLPQCQWSKPDGYGKISQCITTTKHSKAKTVCIFLGIYCRLQTQILENHGTRKPHVFKWGEPWSVIIMNWGEPNQTPVHYTLLHSFCKKSTRFVKQRWVQDVSREYYETCITKKRVTRHRISAILESTSNQVQYLIQQKCVAH